jgi:hypothetical protein
MREDGRKLHSVRWSLFAYLTPDSQNGAATQAVLNFAGVLELTKPRHASMMVFVM